MGVVAREGDAYPPTKGIADQGKVGPVEGGGGEGKDDL